MLLTLPKRALRLTAIVKPMIFKEAQHIDISVDGKIIGSWMLSNSWEWQEHSVVIGPDPHRPNVSVVEFIFSQHLQVDGPRQRGEAVLFDLITLDELTIESQR